MTTATTELDNLVETKGTQELTYFRALLYAAVVGAAGGLTATVYIFCSRVFARAGLGNR